MNKRKKERKKERKKGKWKKVWEKERKEVVKEDIRDAFWLNANWKYRYLVFIVWEIFWSPFDGFTIASVAFYRRVSKNHSSFSWQIISVFRDNRQDSSKFAEHRVRFSEIF